MPSVASSRSTREEMPQALTREERSKALALIRDNEAQRKAQRTMLMTTGVLEPELFRGDLWLAADERELLEDDNNASEDEPKSHPGLALAIPSEVKSPAARQLTEDDFGKDRCPGTV